ncbi:FecR family protein [Pedobacter sp. CFBP9032]|uniref:FecR family protein n=1 Tax=Pedobacter sp. CFBP9032 TaxID=3096539 RepID=UPI002A6B1872|nr:FecR family protein [Pedobacter sp. CFBP9032]MDY0904846.1 FecR family protein [Pedobacter sp. CFBP9032]
MEVPEHIKSLILKWRNQNLSKAEKAELDAWYESPLPEEIYIDAEGREQVKNLLLSNIKSELGHSRKKAVKLFPTWIKIAAAVLLFMGISFLCYQYFEGVNSPVVIHTVQSKAQIRRIILPDSSIVWLKKNSRLSYPETFGTRSREVKLTGEALFEIAHNKHWPFKIRSGNYTTTVLGTSFNLKTGAEDKDFSITVLTGKVEVVRKDQSLGPQKILVAAHHSFHGTAQKAESFNSETNDTKITQLLEGTQYDMSFSKVPFEEIMERFEEKFDVKFEGYTGEYNACLITADLTNLPLEKSLQLLCLSINATYKIDQHKIKLTGGGCF